MPTADAFLIGSQWRTPASTQTRPVISPITEEVIGEVPLATEGDVDAAVGAAREAFEKTDWAQLEVLERGEHLLRLAAALEPRLEHLISLQIDEMGSPRSFIAGRTRAAAAGIRGQLELIDSIPKRVVYGGASGKLAVSKQPVGVVAAIIPWNAPVPLIISRMVAALATGCTLIIKPAPESPLSAYPVAEAIVEAEFPAGVISLLPGGAEVGEALVRHRGVNKVSFTGSTAAGRRVASLCGEGLKHATLELGGKSAAILLDDVDLDAQLDTVIANSLPNNGEVCHATTRILVPHRRKAEIIERLVAQVSAMKVGNPHDNNTRFGPLVSERQRDRVESYIRAGKDTGATIALGGGRPAALDRGWYVEPTIFTDVENSWRVAQEEIFGPVICVIGYDSDDDAVEIANDSAYGLGGGVYSSDTDRAQRVAARIDTGTCVVNSGAPGGGSGPFGGMKDSGLGRERGVEGYASYYEIKSVALPAGVEPVG